MHPGLVICDKQQDVGSNSFGRMLPVPAGKQEGEYCG
jgi:hypothetical protein